MNKKLSLAVIAALYVTSVNAMQFQTLGYKSVAMGGAAVASSSGSLATYNNPALLAKAPYDVEISLGGGVAFTDHGVGASVEALDDSGFVEIVDKAADDVTTLTLADKQNLIDGKNIVLNMNGNALEISPQAYVSAQMGGFGFGVFGSSNVIATAVIDQTHNELIFQNGANYIKIADNGTESVSNVTDYNAKSVEYAMDNGLTYLDARGIAIAEVPVAYGYKLEVAGGNLMVGGAVKYMSGMTYTEQLKLDNSDTDTDTKNDKTSTAFGVDLGVAYEPSFVKDLTLAVVAKNLNSPEFEFTDGSKVEVDPMIRAGVAYNIFESLEIAADIDITSNETLATGVESQMIGGGLNFHPASWFAVRGGVMQNMDSLDRAGMIYTAGVGFGLKWLQLDISGQISGDSTTVDGVDVPQYAKVSVALISRW